jgi:hypothetical protein
MHFLRRLARALQVASQPVGDGGELALAGALAGDVVADGRGEGIGVAGRRLS